jgi:hypothetical protein
MKGERLTCARVVNRALTAAYRSSGAVNCSSGAVNR